MIAMLDWGYGLAYAVLIIYCKGEDIKGKMNVGTLPTEIKMLFCLPVDIAIPIMKYSTCYIYSQTCIKRSPLGQRKKWPFNTGDCLMVVTT